MPMKEQTTIQTLRQKFKTKLFDFERYSVQLCYRDLAISSIKVLCLHRTAGCIDLAASLK